MRRYSKGTSLGHFATEEAARQAYNTEDARVARINIISNVVPPVRRVDADGNNNTAAMALLGLFASAHTHAGAGSKRGSAPTTPALPQRKKMRLDPLDTLAGAAAGARAAASRPKRGHGHQ